MVEDSNDSQTDVHSEKNLAEMLSGAAPESGDRAVSSSFPLLYSSPFGVEMMTKHIRGTTHCSRIL